MAGVPRCASADGLDVVAISASNGEGLDAFRERLAALLPPADELAQPPEPAGVVVHRIEAMADGFAVDTDEDGAFRVRGRRIERIAAQTNFEVEESAERFQRDLPRIGIDAELRRAGVAAGRPRADRGGGARMGGASPGRAGDCGLAARSSRLVRRGSVGVFGGTFDPIHIAHLAVAEEAREALGLETDPVHPGREPPHKVDRPVSEPQHRLAMVELAIADNPAFEAEPDRARPRAGRRTPSTRSSDSRPRRADAEPAGRRAPDLVLILSAEAFRELRTWRAPRADPRARPARRRAARRLSRTRAASSSPSTSRARGPGIVPATDRASGLSASELRERAADGRSLRYLVPDAVAAYIGDHGLYSDPRRTHRS